MSPIVERRAWVRQAVNLQCWLQFNRTDPILSGHVEDISDHGARVSVVGPVPDKFVLHLSTDRMIPIKCEVVRRSTDEIGVRFLEEVHLNIPAMVDDNGPDLRRRIGRR